MGIINVEGLGEVQITGDKPNEEEQKIILETLEKMPASDKDINDKTDSFVKSNAFGRLAIEVGLGIGGSLLTGGAALPALALRAGFIARPFLTQLAKSSLGAAAGSGTGAVAAQPIDPKDDIVKEVVRASTEGALGEAIGGPVTIKAFQVASKILSPKIKLLEAAKQGEEILNAQKLKILSDTEKYGPDLVKDAKFALFTPGVAADSRLVDILENVTEKSLFGAGKLVATKEAAKRVTRSALDDFVEPFVKELPDETTTGRLFFDSIVGSQEYFKKQASKLYGSLDQEVAKLGNANIVPLKEYNKALGGYLKTLPNKGKNTPSAVNLIMDNIISKPSTTFTEANKLRSAVLEIGRDLPEKGAKEYIRAYQVVANELTKAMEKAKVPASSNIVKQWQDANNFYKTGIEKYNEKVIETILKKNDGKDVYKYIISTTDKPETTKKVLKAINNIKFQEPGTAIKLQNNLKGNVLSDMMEKSIREDVQYGDVFDPNKMGKYLDKYKGTLKELFNEREIGTLRKINDAISVAEGRISKTGGLPGGVFIQLKQAGAAGSLLTFGGAATAAGFAGGLPVAAATILLGPKLLSTILTNPKFSKFLIEGIPAQTGTKAGLAFRQLVGRLANDNLIPKEEAKALFDQTRNVEKDLKKIKPSTSISTELKTTPVTPPNQLIPPVNTRVTDVQPKPMAAPMQGTMPAGGLRERISQSNQLDQFIPVRWKEL